MKNKKPLILAIMIIPWLTFPFIGKRTIRKFWPGALFMSLFLLGEGTIAQKRNWWWFYQKLKPNVTGIIPLTVSPFFIGSLWIFKFTYGRFWLYMFINFIVDSFFVYVLLRWFTRIRYVTLVEMNKFQLSLCFLVKSILMYAVQSYVDQRR
ncbi:hypothetical protein [Halalkalibacter alkalisediminis]|uniref:Uncharacterized protein n=1 Tax=Halalkalibacter alkalisediminis TaxID=935616 RepID=A0ABV6NDF3_9BACI|nr:hypothetical protein [Halalkalibacter alkalisediminis]